MQKKIWEQNENLMLNNLKKSMVDGWVDGWMGGCKSHFKDCIQPKGTDAQKRIDGNTIS